MALGDDIPDGDNVSYGVRRLGNPTIQGAFLSGPGETESSHSERESIFLSPT